MERNAENDLHWLGAKVLIHQGSISELWSLLPEFDTLPFQAPNGHKNPHLDMVVRKKDHFPVGVVSKHYRLVQHHEVLERVREALAAHAVPPADTQSLLLLTEFGERMAWIVLFPAEPQFLIPLDATGDCLQLRLCCLNSVDASAKPTAFLAWYRPLLGSSIPLLYSEVESRHRHLPAHTTEEINLLMERADADREAERERIACWQSTLLPQARISEWINGPVREAWGVKIASRAWHILQTGLDAECADPFEKGNPTRKTMKPGAPFPGFPPPARSVFDLGQILAALAHERPAIEDRLEKMAHLPALLVDLAGR